MIEPPRNAPGAGTALVPYILVGCAIAGVCLLSTCLMSIVAMRLTGGQPFLALLAPRSPENGVPVPPADLLFRDDFRDNRAGWTLFNGPTGRAELDNGRLALSVVGPDRNVWATVPRRFADLSLEADSGLERGADETSYGLIFRHLDDSNFYVFEVDGLGDYRLGKVVNGAYISLINPTASDRVQPGQALNRLHVRAVGPHITVGVNGVDVGEVTDGAFGEGDIGVSASLVGPGEARVLFGNLQVARP